jgi:hypothetical protein
MRLTSSRIEYISSGEDGFSFLAGNETYIKGQVKMFHVQFGKFFLQQNFPNPFRTATAIRYSIPSRSSGPMAVHLRIYNIQGQVVDELVRKLLPGGTYTVHWNATDRRGGRLPAGTYICRLQGENSLEAIIKIALLR